MKMPHFLRVEEGLEAYSDLISAASDEGLRVGWLDWGDDFEVGGSLEGAASMGLLRAVVVGPRSTVVVKPRRGEAVLRDLVREHFRGAVLVLIRGSVEATELRPEGELWRLVPLSGNEVLWQTKELVGALRRPRLPGAEPTT
jgi:hypothetical protein